MSDYTEGAAYIDGSYMPLSEAKIPVTHWGYRRSDVTYDVVGVWDGAFFRLDDHLARFRASMDRMRMVPKESDDEIRAIVHRTVALSGLTRSYVAMDCLRAAPPPGAPRQPSQAPSYIMVMAMPWAWVAPPEVQERGVRLMIPTVRRIPATSVDPRGKNFHWGDLTAGQFEAEEAGADFAVLLDHDGNVTEGAGFNVFCVTDGRVATPARGTLEGVTQKSVMELCEEMGLPLEVRDISAEEFREADEIFLSTTAGGIMPASRIDGRMLGNDSPGPVSLALKARFWEKRAEGWHATPVDYAAAEASAAA
ncbi:aminotransferase, class IV [Stappia sp. 22II-S9-Z10]|nr:aminotransferase, class IV [Stappia sp. 22II-S9-Z10]